MVPVPAIALPQLTIEAAAIAVNELASLLDEAVNPAAAWILAGTVMLEARALAERAFNQAADLVHGNPWPLRNAAAVLAGCAALAYLYRGGARGAPGRVDEAAFPGEKDIKVVIEQLAHLATEFAAQAAKAGAQ